MTETKLLYRIEEAVPVVGIGRTRLFDLVMRGEIESVKIGKSRRIPHDALVAYVNRLRAEQGTPAA